MIILYAVPFSLWPMLGKENQYFYSRHPNNNLSGVNIFFYKILSLENFSLDFCKFVIEKE